MSQERQGCGFPGCDKGTNGKVYETLNDMKDHYLSIMDLRLHTRMHLAGISDAMESETMVYKDVEEMTS